MFGRLAQVERLPTALSRVAYTDADVAGRRYTMDLMRAAGLDLRVDPGGNIFGRRAGTDPSLPPILGSRHIDPAPQRRHLRR